jgi:hypothetical protein
MLNPMWDKVAPYCEFVKARHIAKACGFSHTTAFKKRVNEMQRRGVKAQTPRGRNADKGWEFEYMQGHVPVDVQEAIISSINNLSATPAVKPMGINSSTVAVTVDGKRYPSLRRNIKGAPAPVEATFHVRLGGAMAAQLYALAQASDKPPEDILLAQMEKLLGSNAEHDWPSAVSYAGCRDYHEAMDTIGLVADDKVAEKLSLSKATIQEWRRRMKRSAPTTTNATFPANVYNTLQRHKQWIGVAPDTSVAEVTGVDLKWVRKYRKMQDGNA